MLPKILIIEDDKNIQKLLQINFIQEGFAVFQAFDGVGGINKAEEVIPDLIILDINLPKLNGIEVCKKIKSHNHTKHIPIIMLTVRKDEVDKILGFEIGADDYVTKPFSPRELILRVKAVLGREKRPKTTTKLELGEISLDEDTFEVKMAEKLVPLTSTEFKLLKYFLLNKERLLTRETLLNNVWGYDCEVETRTVDAHIKSLRKKLKSKKVIIATLIGMGYKLIEK